MSTVFVNSFVRLTRDVPLSCLRRGDVGVVQSLWFAPDGVYEIEFHVAGQEYPIRTVLRECDFAVEQDRPAAAGDEEPALADYGG